MFLSTCSSLAFGRMFFDALKVPHVVATTTEVETHTAASFARALYLALGNGYTVQQVGPPASAQPTAVRELLPHGSYVHADVVRACAHVPQSFDEAVKSVANSASFYQWNAFNADSFQLLSRLPDVALVKHLPSVVVSVNTRSAIPLTKTFLLTESRCGRVCVLVCPSLCARNQQSTTNALVVFDVSCRLLFPVSGTSSA